MRGLRKPGSCGIPVPGATLKFASVTDPSTYVPLGERGEICIQGPNVMKGYWKNEEATSDSMTADGFLRTGDVAYMDDDGFVFIVDRIKDMLLCGGFNVYPRNIEEAIYTHPAVAEVCVIGIPDEYRGQSPKAFVALKRGAAQFTIDELQRVPQGQARQARDGAGRSSSATRCPRRRSARSSRRRCTRKRRSAARRPKPRPRRSDVADKDKDPLALWRDMLSQWETNVNALANRTMASDEYSSSDARRDGHDAAHAGNHARLHGAVSRRDEPAQPHGSARASPSASARWKRGSTA